MVELLTVIQEACKTHRQDNMRRKRKRDNTRVMLARVMERLARHKVLNALLCALSHDLCFGLVKSHQWCSFMLVLFVLLPWDTRSFVYQAKGGESP